MTSDPRMTAILEDLAAGRIDAADAARRIDALKTAEEARTSAAESPQEPSNEELAAAAGSAESSDPWAVSTDRPQHASYTTESFPSASSASTPHQSSHHGSDQSSQQGQADSSSASRTKPVNTNGVDKITVRAIGRRVRIVGESSVATLAADGPHVLRRNGSVLEVSSDGELGASLDGFSILKAPRNLDEFRSLGLGKELFLRVNPGIEVDVEVTGGSLNTERVPHLGKVRLTAGAAKLLDVEEIKDALIQAGQATIKGTITRGRSRVRAESGSLSIQLADASNVTVHGEAQLGKVSWSGAHTGAGDEVVMGNGSARLDVEVVMGHAAVKVGSEQPAEDLR
jgi:hypothetical protein